MEVFPGRVQLGKDELERDEHAHGHADDAPENRGQGEGPNNARIVWFGAYLRIHEPEITPRCPPLRKGYAASMATLATQGSKAHDLGQGPRRAALLGVQ